MSASVLTVPGLLAELAERHGPEVALRQKQYGLWNEVSYAAYARQVRETALGLQTLGLQPGERVALICENTPLWLYAQLGVQAAGGVSVGLYPAMTAREVGEVLALTGATWAIVQGEEQVDKLLELQASLPEGARPLRRVIYGSERGMRKHAGNDLLLSFSQLTHAGETHQHPLPRLSPDDLAHLTLTSGTTGAMRAVTVTHRQLLGVGQALLNVDPLRPGDDHLSFLPLAWSGEQLMSLSVALQSRLTVNFPESAETVMSDLAELGPQVMYTPPRLWEDLRAEILSRLNASYGLNRRVSKALLGGNVAGDGNTATARGPLARAVLLRPLLDRMGLLRLRRAYVTGSALSPELTRFFQGLGVNLKAAYGQAESMGLSHVQRDSDVRPGQVGQPLPGAEASLGEGGGLRLRAPWLSRGYDVAGGMDEAAAAQGWQDGWLHTGDAGELEADGTLTLRGRLGDLCHTRNGASVEPQASERRLKLSPYIREALVLAEGHDSACALLALDAATVGRWAEGQRLAYSTFTDLSQRPEVAALLRAEVEAANTDLSPAQQVQRFAVLYKPLDADDAELTRTGTLRRSVVASRFAPLVEGLKNGAAQAQVSAEIDYGHGQITRQVLTIPLHSMSVSAAPQSVPVTAHRSLA